MNSYTRKPPCALPDLRPSLGKQQAQTQFKALPTDYQSDEERSGYITKLAQNIHKPTQFYRHATKTATMLPRKQILKTNKAIAALTRKHLTKASLLGFIALLVAGFSLVVLLFARYVDPVDGVKVVLVAGHEQKLTSKITSIISKSDVDHDLALKTAHLFGRFRRQAGSNLGQDSNANPQRSTSSSASSSSGSQDASNSAATGGAALDGGTNDGDRPPEEEVLASLKCDFGSAEAPDLCKFKIIDHNQENPLGKGLANWSLGNGKLALFQGGPLLDASQGNDTNGGYIFYETSNPFVVAPLNISVTSQHQTDFSSAIATARAGRPKQNGLMVPESQYARVADGYNSFQQVSSARLSVHSNLPGPALISPNLTAPGPAGMCLSFQYSIQGLSADELRVYVNDQKTERSRQIWASSESSGGNWTKGEVLYSATNKHSLMFSATGSGGSTISSSYSPVLPKDSLHRKFRGHIALDEIEISKHDPQTNEAACKGHCNFDGDLCGWTNAENGPEDDFDWSFGRGSENLFTGPARDFTSSSNNEPTGSYMYTDSGYPRRPGDRALLLSPMFQPTAVNEAMCMRLAVHMFGSGIGSLAIKIRYADESAGPVAGNPQSGGSGGTLSGGGPSGGGGGANLTSGGGGGGGGGGGSSSPASPSSFSSSASYSSSSDSSKPNDLVIWEMSGDAGNSWHQAQTSVSSSRSPFQVVIEGTIGENHLGNMAIDEISFSSGPCPTSPPVASKNYGDCTFEQSMCYWRNPDADIHLDDLDWIRSADEQSIHGPNFDHTLKRRSGSYLKLENTFREPKSGTRAFLLSPIFQPKVSGSVQCLSFYYYMFMRSISSSGPNLGTIRVYLASNNELVPIWRLTNPISSPSWKHGRASLSTAMLDGQPIAPTKLFQIAFEGIWGDASGGAIALDDITVFDGACDILPAEAKSVPGECTFDVDMCSWSNKTYDMPTNNLDSIDTNKSPFLQSVSSGQLNHQRLTVNQQSTSSSGGRRAMSWQLATVDSRPVNLQDHTYKAPIGYAYVDVLDSGVSQQVAFPLQSSEVTVQAGQQVSLCLSFWFAAYGRQDNNQLNVYMTQASAPPPPPDEGSSGGSGSRSQSSAASGSGGNQAGSQTGASSAVAGAIGGASGNSGEVEAENANAWKVVDGKLLWSVALKNITESSRRKWLYGQVSLKADSNHIVRFVAISNDGGFALDDVSYFDGACESRPAYAKVANAEDEESTGGSGSGSQPIAAPK